MTYLVETYGCQMNKAETAALETIFAERSWTRTDDPGKADLVLVNTCSVRITAENRAWGRIAHFAALKKAAARTGRSFALAVMGCMAERLKAEMREREPAIDYAIGTFQKQAFGLVLEAIESGHRLEDIGETPAFAFAKTYYEPGSHSSFLPIMHGCDNFCAYCIVPYLRGREVSRNPKDILDEAGNLEDRGVREITLLGQNVNSYRWKGEDGSVALDFPGLLLAVAERLRSRNDGGIRRVRFLTSHPKDFTDATIAALASDPVFCRHIHLCVQHGSNRVLEAMNRKYTRESYLDLVGRLRSGLPGVTLSTDILVGFPGETEDDVEATLELMREVRFAHSYMYLYNPRKGTPAAEMEGQIPDKTKKARLARVIALQKGHTAEIMKGLVGSVADVLVEDVSRRSSAELLARTDQDMMAVVPGERSSVGSFMRVRLSSLIGNTFKAEVER